MTTQAELEELMRSAETGEQWAEICRLEAEMLAEYAPPRVQTDRKAGPERDPRGHGIDQVEASVNPDFGGAYPA